MHADELARQYPTARVDRNVLFVDDGNLITSAGTAAGIDACLHLVRRELGSEVTNEIARRMVVPPQRDGGQRQYIDQPIPVRCSEGFAPHLDWILANLDKPHTVATLAERAQHVGAHVRPPVRRGDRPHAHAVGDRPAGALRAHGCSRRPTSTSTGSPSVPASARRRCCATTSAGSSASRRRTTGAGSPAEANPVTRRRLRPDRRCSRPPRARVRTPASVPAHL